MKLQYQIGTPENRAFLCDEAERLLSFGHRFPSPGGGSYWLGDDGTPWKDRNRETWITCRMVHVYSIGQFLGHPGSSELADAGLKGLLGELKDRENGGWYAAVTPDGKPLGPKQCYAHAFVILAATSALLAGRPGASQLLEEAKAVYDRYFWDEERGLAADTWDLEFTQLDPYRGINANMHSVEAFLAVADAAGDEKYRVRAGRIIDHVIEWAAANDWRIPEHFRSDWSVDLECNADRKDDQFKPYGATPGHGIEWARLITQWALSTYRRDECNSDSCGPAAAPAGDSGISEVGAAGEMSTVQHTAVPDSAAKVNAAATMSAVRHGSLPEPAASGNRAAAVSFTDGAVPYLDAAKRLYRRAVSDAWYADGAPGIVYTTDWLGTPIVHDRMQWPLAEAINTSSVLWRVTGEQEYADDYEQFLQYLDETVMDHVNGSWFHQLDADNRLIDTVWPGKSDIYHALQSMLIPLHRPDLSIAAALSRQA